MGLAVAVGVLGLVGMDPTEADAGAEPAPVVELPVPPRLVHTPDTAELTTTTTTVPVETTTTTAPPTTTTTVPTPPAAPPPMASPKASAAPRPAAPSGTQGQAQVEAIADSTGWNWRAAGVRFVTAFYPGDCCHWGVYEAAKSTIWVGPTAFADGNRLRYVVLHELAHAWQYRQNRFGQFISDYATWGFDTIGPALEAGADCVALVWGAARGHYWSCPADAQALAVRRLRGDWR